MSEAPDCVCDFLPAELQPEADAFAIKINPANAHAIAQRDSKRKDFKGLALPLGKVWNAGRVLKLRFLDGNRNTETRRNKVFWYANQWSQYGNISFQMAGEYETADIRILLDNSDVFKSRIGTDSGLVDQATPSMTLGWREEEPSEERYRRKILHEFGHALGCIHEHQQPRATNKINFDEDATYAWFARHNPSWNRDMVYSNILFQYPDVNMSTTSFDMSSIMIYTIRSDWTKEGVFSCIAPTELSDLDKHWLRANYPGKSVQADIEVVGGSTSNDDDVSYFNTMEVRPWRKDGQKAEKEIAFPPVYQPPTFAIGLNSLDVEAGDNCRVKSYGDDIHRDGFRIHIDTWASTRLFSASCSWFKCAPDDPDFIVGTVSVWENGGTVVVDLPMLDDPPTVVCWLNGLDMHYTKNYRLQTYASNITCDSFSLHIETWGNSMLNWASASYIVYKKGLKGVASGTYDTGNADWHHPKQKYTGTSYFTGLTKTPKVMMGLNMIDLECDYGARVRTPVSNITKDKMDWTLESWGDGIMYNASVAYLAI